MSAVAVIGQISDARESYPELAERVGREVATAADVAVFIGPHGRRSGEAARAAGVPEVVVACPRPDASVIAAAIEAGVDRVFRVGGAHAVAAMAYGTRTIPRVDKIVGPGNRWVSAAKSLVSADCGIDFYAGPTEILIVAAKTPPAWVAADLIAQAEHDPDARSRLHMARISAAEARAQLAPMNVLEYPRVSRWIEKKP